MTDSEDEEEEVVTPAADILVAFYSGSFREFFGKIKGFPFPGLATEGIIILRKKFRGIRGSCAGLARCLRG